MEIKPIEFSELLGKVPLSEELLKNHLKLYEGYVTNTNLLMKKLEEIRLSGNALSPEFAELKRRFAWEWNGVRLHELYFENLGGNGDKSLAPRVVDIIKGAFGSFESFKEDLIATAKMRGIGWVVTYFDPHTNNVFNAWINEHNESHLAGLKPLIVLDVFEHAYMLDFGINRPDYINTIFDNLNWMVIESRI
ncbi:MAG: Fe-Mn family superoxide dismutase [Actinobacteria bacterium]|nr:Fe-Mn family superoxide dismutase [Actinomycetota bacterium]